MCLALFLVEMIPNGIFSTGNGDCDMFRTRQENVTNILRGIRKYPDSAFDMLFEGSIRGLNWTEYREASAPEVGEYLIPHGGDLEREQRKLTQTQEMQSKYESLLPMFIASRIIKGKSFDIGGNTTKMYWSGWTSSPTPTSRPTNLI